MSDAAAGGQALDLIAACVTQSVADATFTTNRLLDHKDDVIRDFHSTLSQIVWILDNHEVIDRKTWSRLSPKLARAEILLDLHGDKGGEAW